MTEPNTITQLSEVIESLRAEIKELKEQKKNDLKIINALVKLNSIFERDIEYLQGKLKRKK